MSVSGDLTPGLGHVVQDLAPSSEEVGPHASLVEKLYQRLAREPDGRGPVRIGLELREPRLGFARLTVPLQYPGDVGGGPGKQLDGAGPIAAAFRARVRARPPGAR